MKNLFRRQFKGISKYHWILLAILVVGIFLRTYNLHGWLNFRDDQARDASLAGMVVEQGAPWPLMGAFMSYSGDGITIKISCKRGNADGCINRR